MNEPAVDVDHAPGWLAGDEALALFRHLRDVLPWSVHRIRMFGRWVDSPRLSCWLGDPGAAYTYSGSRFEPHAWPDVLRPLLDRLEASTRVRFNSALVNLYRDGSDYMGWHRDNERELGPAPVIASLSLGASRRFVLRANDDGRQHEWLLANGDLLLIRGDTQRDWKHALPKTARPVGPRINLTFRVMEGR